MCSPQSSFEKVDRFWSVIGRLFQAERCQPFEFNLLALFHGKPTGCGAMTIKRRQGCPQRPFGSARIQFVDYVQRLSCEVL